MVQTETIGLESLGGENLMQSRFWGFAKQAAGDAPLSFRIRWGKTSSTLLLLLQKTFSGYTLAYVPWAPMLKIPEEEQGAFLESLSARLTPLLPDNCLFIRYDLPWISPYDFSAEFPSDRIRELRMNCGTATWNLRKAPTDVQPVHTRIVDLQPGTDEILAGMRAKTRYNIRLARRHAVEVVDAPFSRLSDWYRIYRETALRNGIRLHSYHRFAQLFSTAEQRHIPETRLHLLLAEKDHELLAGMILAVHRFTATYLYGASRTCRRSCMPTYRLQWEAMRIARESGCRRYDLFGIPPNGNAAHPMHGLWRFKTGFGGYSVHRRGCWDYPLEPELYRQHSGLEPAGSGYHTALGGFRSES